MKKNQDKKSIKMPKRLVLYAYIVLILFLITTVSSYAWFSLTSTPRVSNLSICVSAPPGMEISTDPTFEEWQQQITYNELLAENYKLRPATWSEKDQMFYGAKYSIDGKVKEDQWKPLVDDKHSNNTTDDNYYCIATFYARAGSEIEVSFAPATATDSGSTASGTYLVGAPAWNEKKILHDNNGKGAENAIRIGLKITRLNENFTPTGDPTDFFIYEPNADSHSEGALKYVDTPSIDGSDTLINKEKIITQSASTWSESEPVEKDVLSYQMGKFNGSSRLFTMEKNEIVQIQMIIWLEGQDVDCTNAISDACVIANIQFEVKDKGGSGLVPIPK